MIRQATNSDIKTLSNLIHKAWQKDLFDLVESSSLEYFTVEFFASKLKEDISSKTECVIVYEINGEIVGYASGNTKAKGYDSEITELYISPNAQQAGIGSHLFNEMKSVFRSQNKPSMIVWTISDAPNNQFYLKNKPVKIVHRDLNISGVKYDGVGFVYSLV